jgi:hypothetical protein
MPESVLKSNGEHQKLDRNPWYFRTFNRDRPAYVDFPKAIDFPWGFEPAAFPESRLEAWVRHKQPLTG